jgi:hypothetical protein
VTVVLEGARRLVVAWGPGFARLAALAALTIGLASVAACGSAQPTAGAIPTEEEFKKGVIKNLVFRNLANFSDGKRYGTCEFLSRAAMQAKQEMRAAYAYVNPSLGRYGIAALSVHSMWGNTTTEPACHENIELHAGIALAP